MTPSGRETTLSLADPVSGAVEPMDDGLHFARAWHRYRYCCRWADSLRILDAGCGAGRSTLWAARLNPGASLIGVDSSAASVELARERGEASGLADLTFQVNDLNQPLPDSLGRFDFIISRKVLEHVADPARVLETLARGLDPRGLLFVTFPSRAGRRAALALRRAVAALAPRDAGAEVRAEIGIELFHGLRPDHPIRAAAFDQGSEPERVVADALAEQRDWTLEGIVSMLERAGLTFLYAATPWKWRADRVLETSATSDALRGSVESLAPAALSRLIDALDPELFKEDYCIYACRAGYAPSVPTWPQTRREHPRSFDALVPHLTGLAEPTRTLPSASQARVTYRFVSGAHMEIDRLSNLMLESVDGRRTCAEIVQTLVTRTRASDDALARQECWIHLADSGLVILEPPGIA
jgi:SAM-dependent methyltransferase